MPLSRLRILMMRKIMSNGFSTWSDKKMELIHAIIDQRLIDMSINDLKDFFRDVQVEVLYDETEEDLKVMAEQMEIQFDE